MTIKALGTQRAAATSAVQCDTCTNGCDCTGGTPGCEHYACWGVVPATVANTCPAAPAMAAAIRARYASARDGAGPFCPLAGASR